MYLPPVGRNDGIMEDEERSADIEGNYGALDMRIAVFNKSFEYDDIEINAKPYGEPPHVGGEDDTQCLQDDVIVAAPENSKRVDDTPRSLGDNIVAAALRRASSTGRKD